MLLRYHIELNSETQQNKKGVDIKGRGTNTAYV